MPSRLATKAAPFILLLAPVLAILAGRLATHSELAARHPREAGILFLWLCADALSLALIAKAPNNRPGLRALLGAIAAGCIAATLASADPVRAALLDMQAVLAAMFLTVLAYAVWSGRVVWRTYSATGSVEAALAKILPPMQVRLALHEIATLRLALFSWGAPADIPAGAQGFAYHRVINPMIGAFLVLQIIEILAVDLLVSHWSETAALVLLALGLWGVIFLVALMKAFRLYPILLEQGALRVRSGNIIDMRVPFDAIAGIGNSITDAEAKRKDVLNAAILSHPNVVIELSRPLTYRGLLGGKRAVERIAFRLDDPAPFLAALSAEI